ncbi:MAG: M48 family metallopeptidase [Bacteroidales bacterium]|jgi:heat shock protein HtpX|nr:M48 family metallopeptidase [Bacteroidales bacterium]
MYELIASNKRKSWVVFIAMGLLLIGIGAGAGYILGQEEGIIIGIAIAAVVWIIQAAVALGAGSQVVLQGLNAQSIESKDDPELYNIIEELSMGAGVAMPKIYIIPTPALNAFAAGTKKNKSIVAITSGLRGKLSRPEIQAVMAHEMSHIYNRDVLYLTFASVMLCTIVIVSDLLMRYFFWGGGGRRNNNRNSSGGNNGYAQLIIWIVVIALAILAPLFARLFYFSLSRKREYLADVQAVNFTRDPDALANALEKISGDHTEFNPGKMAAAMCINVPKSHKTSAFSTHPPIAKRIAILRAMSHGTDYQTYCKAYEQIIGKNDLPKPKKSKK